MELEYLTEDDLRHATPELLDQWFPAWRQVAAELLSGVLATQTKPQSSES